MSNSGTGDKTCPSVQIITGEIATGFCYCSLMRILIILNILIPLIALISSVARSADLGGAKLRDQLTADFSTAAISYMSRNGVNPDAKLTLISGEYDTKVCDQEGCKIHSQVRFLATSPLRSRSSYGQTTFLTKTFLVDVDKDSTSTPATSTSDSSTPSTTTTTFSVQAKPNDTVLGKTFTVAPSIADAAATELRDRVVSEFAEATNEFVVQQSLTKGTSLRHILGMHDNTDDDPDSSGTINVPLINTDIKLTLINAVANSANCEQHALCKPQSQVQFLATIASRTTDKDTDSFSVVAVIVSARRDASVQPAQFKFDLIPTDIHLENN